MKPLGIAAFLAGAAIVVLLVVRAGFPVLLDALSALGLAGLLIVACVHLPVVALLGTAWWTIARGAEHPGLSRFIWARAVRDAAAEALPFSQVGGYVIGARALVLSGAGASWAGISTLLDLALEFMGKIPYVLAGLAFLAVYRPNHLTLCAVAGVAICAIAIVFVLQARPGGWPARITALAVSRWPRLAGMHAKALAVLREMISRRDAVWTGILLHLVCWAAGAAETWLIFRLMHRPIGLAPALVIDSLVGAIRAVLFFVPGALGIQEGGYVLLCGLFGLPPGAALALSLARRARDLLIAAPVLLSWQWREGRALPGRFKS
jgi:putative membrane protein